MKKTMYSLMLSQDVVARVDLLAHSKGTSRSSLINEILAQYFAIDTPQLKQTSIFDATASKIENSVQQSLRVESTDSGFVVFGVLPFKYNPTIRYQFVFQWMDGEETSQLRISSRTQNNEVRQQIESFFELWQEWEQELLRITDSKWNQKQFIRQLNVPLSSQDMDYAILGETIADYVQLLNNSLSSYFVDQTASLKEDYQTFLDSHNITL